MVFMVSSVQVGGKIEQRDGLEKATLMPRRYRKMHDLFRATCLIFFIDGPHSRRIAR
jgi:hypothetical protein